MRIVFFFGFMAALGLLSTPQAAAQNKSGSVPKKELSNPFFVFNNGPVGLQCYNVKGDKYENLKTSMATWRQYRQRMARGE